MHRDTLLGVRQRLWLEPHWHLKTDGDTMWLEFDWKRMSGPRREQVCFKCGLRINGKGSIRSFGRRTKTSRKIYAHKVCL